MGATVGRWEGGGGWGGGVVVVVKGVPGKGNVNQSTTTNTTTHAMQGLNT